MVARRGCPFCPATSQKQTGQAAYMVGVVMRDQHVVDAFEAQVSAAHGGLRALAAVDQHGAAVGAHI